MNNLPNNNFNNNSLLDEQTTNSFQSLIIFNDNLRKHNYIHHFFNETNNSHSK